MKHAILFTGHMIDAKDRKTPRFPPGKEPAVRKAIQNELRSEKEKYKDQLKGIAGGASGGDIIFHELCREMNIPSEVYLALPKEEYKKTSVSFAGQTWDNRFEDLISTLPVKVLPANNEGDKETGKEKDESIWVRTNLWMLHEALKAGGENMTLIALWNGKGGDGEGGTEHMVQMAKQAGARTIIIDINKL